MKKRNIVFDDGTSEILEELNGLAEASYRESEARVGPGEYPFRSTIVRKALQIAAPAIRSGLQNEGVAFLL